MRQHERQIEKHERRLVRQIVHGVHDEAETVRLIAGSGLDQEDCAVEGGGSCQRLAIMGHRAPTVSRATMVRPTH